MTLNGGEPEIPRSIQDRDLLYYYHRDHLGSSTAVSNDDGKLSQQIEYLPYGEVFLEKQMASSDYHSPYRFNGKELDEETGLYYYGARYMNPRLSIWYGTDRLEEEYPYVSSYAYCAGNPVIHIDPNGKSIETNEDDLLIIQMTVPNEYRKYIRINSENQIDQNLIRTALNLALPNSDNFNALYEIVTDEELIRFSTTKEGYSYLNRLTGMEEFQKFEGRFENEYQTLLGFYEDKEFGKTQLEILGISDDGLITAIGKTGATLRPRRLQDPYPGEQISLSNNMEVYINSNISVKEQVINAAHELFSHVLNAIRGNDPRHGHGSVDKDASKAEEEAKSNF